MPEDDVHKAPLYHDAGRLTFVGAPRLLPFWTLVERCGAGNCRNSAVFEVTAILNEDKQGDVRLCSLHTQPLLSPAS